MRAEPRETLHRPDDVCLTPRQQEVMQLVGQGLSNKEIGDALGLATATVKAHLVSISEKLRLRGRVRIALFARSVL